MATCFLDCILSSLISVGSSKHLMYAARCILLILFLRRVSWHHNISLYLHVVANVMLFLRMHCANKTGISSMICYGSEWTLLFCFYTVHLVKKLWTLIVLCRFVLAFFICPYESLEHKMSIQPVQPRQFVKPLLQSSWFVNTEFWPNCPLGWDCQVEGEISVPCYSGGEPFFWSAWQVWAWPCWTLWSSCEYFASAFLNVSPWFGNGVKEKNKRYIAQFSGQSPIGS